MTTIAFQLPCITDSEDSSCVAGAGASILYAPEEQPQIEHTHLDGLTHTHGSGDIPHGHDSLAVIPDSGVDTSIPPYERAPITNARVVNAFGNSLSDVSVNQQVQIGADLVNAQDIDLPFAYLVQIKDNNGVIVSLSWITGEMSAGQTLSPALSWIPDASGTYEATIFLWESVINPTVLSDTISVNITVV